VIERDRAVIRVWTEHSNSERSLREKTTTRILGLIFLQTLAVVAIVFTAGMGAITLPADFYKFGLPSMSGVIALALVMIKYLFDRQPGKVSTK
jgi:uncharacterized membrane protein YkvI